MLTATTTTIVVGLITASLKKLILASTTILGKNEETKVLKKFYIKAKSYKCAKVYLYEFKFNLSIRLASHTFTHIATTILCGRL